MDKRPHVGIGVIVIKDGQVLMGKRKNAHGEGMWSFPGGHLEFNESWAECAIREAREETSLTINNIRFGAVTNDIFKAEDKHYITIFMLADYAGGALQIREPDKCGQWAWFDWDKLPQPLFRPIQNLLKTKYHPF